MVAYLQHQVHEWWLTTNTRYVNGSFPLTQLHANKYTKLQGFSLQKKRNWKMFNNFIITRFYRTWILGHFKTTIRKIKESLWGLLVLLIHPVSSNDNIYQTDKADSIKHRWIITPEMKCCSLLWKYSFIINHSLHFPKLLRIIVNISLVR